MKVFALIFVIFAVLASTSGLKDPVCGFETAKDGNGLIACFANMPSWSYNSGTNQCVDFIYGGCGGNKNRFPSKELCESTCLE